MAGNIKDKSHFSFIIVGGGIAGVTCAETLSFLHPEDSILLLTASSLIKAVTNYKKISKLLEEFDVEEKPAEHLETACRNVRVVHTAVTKLEAGTKELLTTKGVTYTYDRLCICSGGKPKVIASDNPYVLGIRDTETVEVFQKKLVNAKRIVVVGNGGIATEVVYEIRGCDIVWAIKDDSITSTFVDSGAAVFLLPQLEGDRPKHIGPVKRTKYTVRDDVSTSRAEADALGGALGPDWASGVDMKGACQSSPHIHVEYKVEVAHIYTAEEFEASGKTAEELTSNLESQTTWPVYVALTNGKIYGCDFVVSATGVEPCTHPFTDNNQFEIAEDGGLKVNDKMMTSVPGVWAAGDVCTAGWEHAKHWLQMRLWSQARQMGYYAAKCMVADVDGEEAFMEFCFEIFAHSTKFFNYKVVLLGKFNGQGLGEDYNILLRVTKGVEYVKAVMGSDGRMHGAILIGETDLEETFENLILNQMDLSQFGESLLDPNIEIDDFFD